MNLYAEKQARARHRAALRAALPEHLARLRWDRERIELHQRDALRALLGGARRHSPFHASRLAGVDPDTFELDDLKRLPTMTKVDVMGEFDAIVGDDRLSRELVERHLAGTGTEPRYLLDGYTVLASGGSSGERGVFVFGWDELVDYAAGILRTGVARMMAAGGPPPGGATMALVAAGSAIHATRAGAVIFGGDPVTITSVPVTLPLGEIVGRLNALQPTILQGYPSILGVLAAERSAGRLAIAPRVVTGNSEQFPWELRERVAEAFGVAIADQFGSTEGVVGISEPGDRLIVLASDLAIVELVDDDNRPVPQGEPSAKVLVTNLFNRTQPLIRYELTDRFVREPDAADHGHLRVTVEGRQDELLRFGEHRLHPNVVRSVLLDWPAIVEYQVRQHATGLGVAVVLGGTGRFDAEPLAGRLRSALDAAGVSGAEVQVTVSEAVERHPLTGKARRFITWSDESEVRSPRQIPA
jgi:phenylacetate-coenzyme A ligase PaaK-like adenylate-forming protein